jgi:hypothetical protein
MAVQSGLSLGHACADVQLGTSCRIARAWISALRQHLLLVQVPLILARGSSDEKRAKLHENYLHARIHCDIAAGADAVLHDKTAGRNGPTATGSRRAPRCLPSRRRRNRSASTPDCWNSLARVRCVIHGSAGRQMQKTTARKFYGAPPGNAKAIPISGPFERVVISAYGLRHADRVRTCPVIGCRLTGRSVA